MSKSVLDMSMSLDGFIAGPADSADGGLGVITEYLHSWLGEPVGRLPGFEPPGASGVVFSDVMASGAVVVGHKTFTDANEWGGDHHGVPIFVPTRGEPPESDFELVTYVGDVETAISQAKEAAGEANVMVHGADLAQSLLKAGLLDEMEIHLIPVLLGEGLRLFEHLGVEPRELELTRVVDAPGVTHLHYRVAS